MQAAREAGRQHGALDIVGHAIQGCQLCLRRGVAAFGQAFGQSTEAGRQSHGVGADDEAIDFLATEQATHLPREQRRPQPLQRADRAQMLAGLDAELAGLSGLAGHVRPHRLRLTCTAWQRQ